MYSSWGEDQEKSETFSDCYFNDSLVTHETLDDELQSAFCKSVVILDWNCTFFFKGKVQENSIVFTDWKLHILEKSQEITDCDLKDGFCWDSIVIN